MSAAGVYLTTGYWGIPGDEPRCDALGSRGADWLGVPHHTLSALVGPVVAQGRDNTDALRIARPSIDITAKCRAREAVERGEFLDKTDLYDDIRPALSGLRKLGIRVVIADNQRRRAPPPHHCYGPIHGALGLHGSGCRPTCTAG